MAPIYTYPPLAMSVISDPQASSYGGGGGAAGVALPQEQDQG